MASINVAQSERDVVGVRSLRTASHALPRVRRMLEGAGLRTINAPTLGAVREHVPAVLITLVEDKKRCALTWLSAVRDVDPSIRNVVLTRERDREFVAAALRSGAALVLAAPSTPAPMLLPVIELLAHAARLRGDATEVSVVETTADSGQVRAAAERFADAFSLTRRERQVLPWMLIAEAYKETAKQISIDPRTVRWHAENIKRKAGMSWPAIRAKCIDAGLAK